MSNGTLAKVSAKTAAEICKLFKLGDGAAKLLRDNQTPRQFLDVLVEKQQYADACRFLAHALPKREALWWACLCVRQVQGANPPKAAAALQAAEKWVADPSDANRRAAMPAAEAADIGTPAGCTAAGVFFSGGSLGPPNIPAIPPGENLTAVTVAGAVIMAGVLTEPAKGPEKYRKFIALGIEVANGTNRWKESAAPPAAGPRR